MKRFLDLQNFFPEEISIVKRTEVNGKITIKLKSKTKVQICPSCGQESKSYHSTYTRKIQDLPLFCKPVVLQVTAYKYNCDNTECVQKIFCEELNGFTGKYRRMTSRCEDMVKTIAMNTNCEGAAIICNYMGIKVSGDTIIRMILKNSENEKACGEVIGVDDWAFKKRCRYGTIICDSQTHKPVALLDGRDGTELKKWLEKNKHIKIVTRDRASSYAKAISEALPEAIQVADRFHLHQNLLKAIKDAIGREIPEKIEMPTKMGGTVVPEYKLLETKILKETFKKN